MSELVSAVFESGVFRPTRRPQLSEGEQVDILVRPRRLMSPRQTAMAIAEAAALPVENPGDPGTGTRHDFLLYGQPHQP